jgi:hypothetical protein
MSFSNDINDYISLSTEPGVPNPFIKKKSSAYLMIENQINVLPMDFFQNIIELENTFTEYNDVGVVHKLVNMYKVTMLINTSASCGILLSSKPANRERL